MSRSPFAYRWPYTLVVKQGRVSRALKLKKATAMSIYMAAKELDTRLWIYTGELLPTREWSLLVQERLLEWQEARETRERWDDTVRQLSAARRRTRAAL